MATRPEQPAVERTDADVRAEAQKQGKTHLLGQDADRNLDPDAGKRAALQPPPATGKSPAHVQADQDREIRRADLQRQLDELDAPPKPGGPEYPAYRYSHDGQQKVIVSDAQQDAALEGGWSKTPVDPNNPNGPEPTPITANADPQPKRKAAPAQAQPAQDDDETDGQRPTNQTTNQPRSRREE